MALRPSKTDETLLASGSEDTYVNFTEGYHSTFYADNSPR